MQLLLLPGNYFVLDAGEEKLAWALAAGGKEKSIDRGEIYQYFR